MDAKMEQLILDARRVKASDIHITEGMPVWYRVHGKLAKSQLQFSGEELRALLMGSMDERQKEIFASGRDVDFGLEISDGSRQRVNIFLAAASGGGGHPPVEYGDSHVGTAEDANPALPDGTAAERTDSCDRTDRKRKVHDTCGDDRTCEPEQRPAYYYDRRSDRVQISM